MTMMIIMIMVVLIVFMIIMTDNFGARCADHHIVNGSHDHDDQDCNQQNPQLQEQPSQFYFNFGEGNVKNLLHMHFSLVTFR